MLNFTQGMCIRCNPQLCQYLLGMSKNQSVKVFKQEANTSDTWFKNMTTNCQSSVNSYGPVLLGAKSYAQVLKDGGKNNTIDYTMDSQNKGVKLNRSFTSVVNGYGHNSFRDHTDASSHSKDIDSERSYLSVVGNTVSTNKDKNGLVHKSPPRGGVVHGKDITKDGGAGENQHLENSDLNPGRKMGQQMDISCVPASTTPTALTPRNRDVNEIVSEDHTIFDASQQHNSKISKKVHAENDHSCKIFYINGLDEKYLTSILLNTPKKKLWKNLDHPMVKLDLERTVRF